MSRKAVNNKRVGCKTFCEVDKRAKESEGRYRPAVNPPENDMNIPNCVWAVRFALLFLFEIMSCQSCFFSAFI